MQYNAFIYDLYTYTTVNTDNYTLMRLLKAKIKIILALLTIQYE